jgi:hypothetical protein
MDRDWSKEARKAQQQAWAGVGIAGAALAPTTLVVRVSDGADWWLIAAQCGGGVIGLAIFFSVFMFVHAKEIRGWARGEY